MTDNASEYRAQEFTLVPTNQQHPCDGEANEESGSAPRPSLAVPRIGKEQVDAEEEPERAAG